MTAEVTLASADVRVVVVPESGGKIASLEHVPTGREWLLAPPRRWPRPGAHFTDPPLWGWDEMVPTIDACMGLPDHGEAWSGTWSSEPDGCERLRCAFEGRALPYRLVRDLTVTGAGVTIEYELSATAPTPLLWAAHPQFALDPRGTRVRLPLDVAWLVDVRTGEATGAHALTDPLRDLPRGAGRKLYVDPDVAVDQVTLADEAGPWLTLRWDAAQLPYLGAWVDHGAIAPRPVVVIEPANAYFDSLERAIGLGRVAEAAPGRPLRWRLELELGTAAA